MAVELIAERTMDLAVGAVRMTVARHDDGHYTGVAALVGTGTRIGLLSTRPVTSEAVETADCLVDETLADRDLIEALTWLVKGAAGADLAVLHG
jgi:hypothetical protein